MYQLQGQIIVPDSKVHGAYMGPTWGRQDPGGPHVDPMILAIWGVFNQIILFMAQFVNNVIHSR